MELKQFEKLLEYNNGLKLTDNLIIFNDLELYDMDKDKSINFKDYNEFYSHKINKKTIGSIIKETKEFIFELEGGRGTGSSNSQMGGGFTSANQRGRKSEDYGATQFPARINTGNQRYKSYEQTLKNFEKLYKDAKIEYGASIDENGYATQLIKGASVSVPIQGKKGEMAIHNHPSGGNFSKADLISTAMSQEKGLVAVGSNTTKARMRYTITKNKNFKAKEFVKAVNKAQWPKQYSYDKGADWWLRKNAKTYGYTYSAKKIK